MELTTSDVILFQFIVVFCNGINPTIILNFGGSYDKILPGHGYELLKVKTLEHCLRICLYSPKCLSVNWNTKTKYCQLNPEDVGTGTTLVMSTGNLYVPAWSSNIQNHACLPSPCRYGEVCIPATATTSFVCLRPDTAASIALPTTDPATTAAATAATSTTLISTLTVTSTTIPTVVTSINLPPTTSTSPSTTTTVTRTSTSTSTPTTTTTTTTTTTITTTTITTTTTTATTTPSTTQDLSQYSDSFRRIQGYVVWLLNNETYTSVSSVSTCEQYCIQHTAFTCRSYEYYYGNQWCFLQSFIKDDALSEWTADSRADYFQRLRLSEL